MSDTNVVVIDEGPSPVIDSGLRNTNARYLQGILITSTTPSDGQILSYNASTQTISFKDAVGVDELDDVGDVDESAPATGDVLVYNGSSWVGEPVQATGSGSPSGSVTPAFVGQQYRDTSTGQLYISMGATNSDWKEVLISA